MPLGAWLMAPAAQDVPSPSWNTPLPDDVLRVSEAELQENPPTVPAYGPYFFWRDDIPRLQTLVGRVTS